MMAGMEQPGVVQERDAVMQDATAAHGFWSIHRVGHALRERDQGPAQSHPVVSHPAAAGLGAQSAAAEHSARPADAWQGWDLAQRRLAAHIHGRSRRGPPITAAGTSGAGSAVATTAAAHAPDYPNPCGRAADRDESAAADEDEDEAAAAAAATSMPGALPYRQRQQLLLQQHRGIGALLSGAAPDDDEDMLPPATAGAGLGSASSFCCSSEGGFMMGEAEDDGDGGSGDDTDYPSLGWSARSAGSGSGGGTGGAAAFALAGAIPAPASAADHAAGSRPALQQELHGGCVPGDAGEEGGEEPPVRSGSNGSVGSSGGEVAVAGGSAAAFVGCGFGAGAAGGGRCGGDPAAQCAVAPLAAAASLAGAAGSATAARAESGAASDARLRPPTPRSRGLFRAPAPTPAAAMGPPPLLAPEVYLCMVARLVDSVRAATRGPP